VPVAAAIILSVALVLNLVSVALLRRWASWMYDQRRRGYPDERAWRLDRRSVWIGVAAGWLWANIIMLLGASVAASQIH
jgi:hypothetical protein